MTFAARSAGIYLFSVAYVRDWVRMSANGVVDVQRGGGLRSWLQAMSAPSPLRSFLIDVGIVLVFCTGHAMAVGLLPAEGGKVHWWPLLVCIPATCGLLVRHWYPWPVLVVPVAAEYVLTAMNVESGLLYLVELTALYSVCVRTNLIGMIIGGLLPMIYMTLEIFRPILTVKEVATTIVGVVMVIGWAQAMKASRRWAVQLEGMVSLLREAQDQIAVDAAVVERVRIAREFHDIVSHNLSVVALRAGVARTLVDQDREHARETLKELETTSRAALEEMRYSLGALRTDDAGFFGSAPGEKEELARQPAPRLDRVDALVEAVQHAGVEWTLQRCGTVRELSSSLEVTAYRVVQEAVTNVLKHACSGHAQILLDYGTKVLKVEVSNRVAGGVKARPVEPPKKGPKGAKGSLPTSGHGLIGLRERVALHGGTLAAYPVPGGFHVAAVFPVTENPPLPEPIHKLSAADGEIKPVDQVRRYRRIR